MQRPVSHHSSVVIIQKKGFSDFMFQKYDGTYPRVQFRNQAHVIGGNYHNGDSSPGALLYRELEEEFSQHEEDPDKGIEKHLVEVIGQGPGAQRVGEFASLEMILKLKRTILQNHRPFADLLCHYPKSDNKEPYSSVVSSYTSFVEPELFESVRDSIRQGKAVRNEGATLIATADEIISGDIPAAWFTRDLMGIYFGRSLQNIHGIVVESIGLPQDSWDTYRDRFDYKIKLE